MDEIDEELMMEWGEKFCRVMSAKFSFITVFKNEGEAFTITPRFDPRVDNIAPVIAALARTMQSLMVQTGDHESKVIIRVPSGDIDISEFSQSTVSFLGED